MKPEANEFTNHVFSLPGGDAANDLPVQRVAIDGTATTHTSFWRPNESDLKALEAGAVISLTIWGQGHPPVALGTIQADPPNMALLLADELERLANEGAAEFDIHIARDGESAMTHERIGRIAALREAAELARERA